MNERHRAEQEFNQLYLTAAEIIRQLWIGEQNARLMLLKEQIEASLAKPPSSER